MTRRFSGCLSCHIMRLRLWICSPCLGICYCSPCCKTLGSLRRGRFPNASPILPLHFCDLCPSAALHHLSYSQCYGQQGHIEGGHGILYGGYVRSKVQAWVGPKFDSPFPGLSSAHYKVGVLEILGPDNIASTIAGRCIEISWTKLGQIFGTDLQSRLGCAWISETQFQQFFGS